MLHKEKVKQLSCLYHNKNVDIKFSAHKRGSGIIFIRYAQKPKTFISSKWNIEVRGFFLNFGDYGRRTSCHFY